MALDVSVSLPEGNNIINDDHHFFKTSLGVSARWREVNC